MTDSNNLDLIDRIGAALPAEVRADYFREMMHCRSLPENDEMLRILRAMQFLMLLMDQVPARVVKEREQLDKLFSSALQRLEKSIQDNRSSLEKLDQRLLQLPGFIAAGISPETIVAKINTKLQEAFFQSTIPDTAVRLGAIASLIKEVNKQFAAAADDLGDSYRGAVKKAGEAITNMNQAIAKVADSAGQAAKQLSAGFHAQYWWSVLVLISVALLLGFFAGALFMHRLDQPAQKVERISAPLIEAAPPVKTKSKR
jgi:methyl-accepting chemotaxis protein